MRDVAVLIFLIGCIVATFRQPWLGVLGLAIFSYMNPHAFAWGFMRDSVPAYQILFIVVAIAMFTTEDRQRTPRDWRIPTFFLLWFYFFLTTTVALVREAAWAKLFEVSKIYLPMLLTLWLINTRRKLHFLIVTIAASVGLIAVKGGIWAILSGFQYRVYGPEGTQFYENNAFAVATNMAIPLIILWLRETDNKWLRRVLMAAVPLCMASSLSSWSRGGLLSLAATTVFLTWNSRRRVLVAIPLLAVGIYLATQYLPEEWFARMHTMETYEEDASAMSRLTAWTDGFHWALAHPFKGAGFEGWRYVTHADWHSSYVEIMAEHGLVAFAMWFSLLCGTLVSLTRLPRLTRHIPEAGWVENYSLMLRASLVAYATGTVFLGLSYWDIFYHMVFIAVLTKQFALAELAQHQQLQTAGSRPPAPALRPSGVLDVPKSHPA
jgi:probable O-glycosylation ligase (exosortase A-associated)